MTSMQCFSQRNKKGQLSQLLAVTPMPSLVRLEYASPRLTRFVHGLHSDDDSDDHEDWNSRQDVRRKKKQLQIEKKKMKSAVKTKAITRMQKNAVFGSKNAGLSYESGNSMVAGLEEAQRREYRWDTKLTLARTIMPQAADVPLVTRQNFWSWSANPDRENRTWRDESR